MRTVAWGIQGANSHLWLFTKCYWFCLLNTSRSRCLLLIQNTLVFLQACLHDLSCFLTGLLVPVSHATSLVSLKSFSHPAARKTIQKQNTSSCNFLVYNILSPIVFNTPEGYNMLPPEEGLQWLIVEATLHQSMNSKPSGILGKSKVQVPLKNVDFNCTDPLICRFFSVINAVVLDGPWLVETNWLRSRLFYKCRS